MNQVKHNSRFQDLTGQKFNRLQVLRWAGVKNNRTMWECRCDCGSVIVTGAHDIKTGHTQSCGCYNAQRRRETNVKHGHSFVGRQTVEYRAYCHAKGRCQNPNLPNFVDYGGRGIEFRFESFEAFYAELGPRPTPRHSVDRKDNSGHYERGNVRWATRAEQNRNKRNTVQFTINDVTKTITEWSRVGGSRSRDTINSRWLRGFCAECCVFGPQWHFQCPHSDIRTNKAFA